MTDKPPPTARSARDRQQMDKWSNEQLDDFAERSMFWLRGENMDLKVARELSGSGDPIRAAKFGDVDPLRKAYPQIAAKGARQEAAEGQVGRTVAEGREQPDPRRVGRGAATRNLGGPVRQAAKELPVGRGDRGKAARG